MRICSRGSDCAGVLEKADGFGPMITSCDDL